MTNAVLRGDAVDSVVRGDVVDSGRDIDESVRGEMHCDVHCDVRGDTDESAAVMQLPTPDASLTNTANPSPQPHAQPQAQPMILEKSPMQTANTSPQEQAQYQAPCREPRQPLQTTLQKEPQQQNPSLETSKPPPSVTAFPSPLVLSYHPLSSITCEARPFTVSLRFDDHATTLALAARLRLAFGRAYVATVRSVHGRWLSLHATIPVYDARSVGLRVPLHVGLCGENETGNSVVTQSWYYGDLLIVHAGGGAPPGVGGASATQGASAMQGPSSAQLAAATTPLLGQDQLVQRQQLQQQHQQQQRLLQQLRQEHHALGQSIPSPNAAPSFNPATLQFIGAPPSHLSRPNALTAQTQAAIGAQAFPVMLSSAATVNRGHSHRAPEPVPSGKRRNSARHATTGSGVQKRRKSTAFTPPITPTIPENLVDAKFKFMTDFDTALTNW